MNTKGQGISLTTIVIAAVALLVLVVLSVIFIGRSGEWATKSSECTNKGGKCITGTSLDGVEKCQAEREHKTYFSGWACADTTKICCIKVAS